MIPAEEFRRFAEGLVERARTVLVRDGFHGPVAFVFPDEGPPVVVGFGPNPAGLRMYQLLRAAVRKMGGKAVILLNEAWMVSTDPEGAMAFVDRGGRVKDFPGRGEALLVYAAHPEGRWSWQIPFSREVGRFVFGKMESCEGDAIMGGMAKVLDG